MAQDIIRWQQRFANYQMAIEKLGIAVEILHDELDDIDEDDEEAQIAVDEILQDGLIHRFEYTYQLAWNMMKAYAEQQGQPIASDPREALQSGAEAGLIDSIDTWLAMNDSIKLCKQTYNTEAADEVYSKIVSSYYPLLLGFEEKMGRLISGQS